MEFRIGGVVVLVCVVFPMAVIVGARAGLMILSLKAHGVCVVVVVVVVFGLAIAALVSWQGRCSWYWYYYCGCLCCCLRVADE